MAGSGLACAVCVGDVVTGGVCVRVAGVGAGLLVITSAACACDGVSGGGAGGG
jgi:hypothetical protein